ncbi:MAG: glycosyltransferase family 2 protein [Candidatus Hodarchaeota archaeon]
MNIGHSPTFLLLTNVWNEEGNLNSVFAHIAKQTKKPTYWLIINDGSVDNTLKELKELSSKYSDLEISIYSMPPKTRGNLDTLGVAIRTALKSVNGKFDYYAKLDIDTVLPENYFERIFQEFDKDPKLMCASGAIYYRGKKELNRRKWARGSGLIIKGPFFDYYRHNIPEVTLETWIGTLARIHDFKTKEFPKIKAVQLIQTTQLTKKGAFRRGRLAYYFGFNPLSVFIRAIIAEFVFKTNGKQLIWGYLVARQKKWQINNKKIRHYWFHQLFFLDIKSLFGRLY